MQTSEEKISGEPYTLGYNDDDDAYSDDDIIIISEDHHHTTINCRILDENDIRQRIDDEISKISSLVSLPKPQATLLLCFFNWSVAKIHDSWFSDQSGLCLKLGLLEKPVQISATEFTCRICSESFSCDDISSAACGHPFCNHCWSTYITTSINNNGAQCLMLRCPEPSCVVAIGSDMVGTLVSGDDMKKYSRCLVRSYVQGNESIKWCPGPECVYAIEAEGIGGFDVTCRCLGSFCWDCEEEMHRPVDCKTVKAWMSKVKSWILKDHAENGGCMDMHCRHRRHYFCWICLSPGSAHVECNQFSKGDAKEKKMEKQPFKRHHHYFERWDANRKSKLKALQDFQDAKNVAFKKLSEAQGVPEENLDFLNKAWLQVIECRRVLEWSYVYGYYMPEKEHPKKQFFEYLQGEAENALEKLHDLTENEVREFLNGYDLSKDFSKFQTELTRLTVVTGNYFEKLVKALENGLSDVVPYAKQVEDRLLAL
ncbi:RING/U-box superfamily protein [Euphorbia peplus]|nr:RING/U-box superfamily protein [Euphorbia peplus]